MRFLKYLLAGSALFFSLGNVSNTMAQNYKWVKGTTTDLNTGKMAMDNNRHIVTSGTFIGDVDLDFSDAPADTAVLRNSGSFIAHYDATGNFDWAFRLGNASDSLVDIKSVQTDDSGNVYVAGHFTGIIDFNPSAAAADTAIEASLNLFGLFNPCIYVAKYNSNGQFVWVMNLRGILPELWGMNVRNNKLYLAGALMSYADAPEGFTSLDFNPSKLPADTFYAPVAPGTNEWEMNPFYAIYNTNGTLVSAQRISGTPTFKGFDIDADAMGNIYMAGSLMGQHDVNASLEPADTLSLSGNQGVFVASYTEAGNFRWAAPVIAEDNFGFVIPENPVILKVINSAVYVSGLFKASADFNPGTAAADTLTLTAGTGNGGSSYLAHYDTSGHFITAHTLRASGEADRINAIASDDSGHVYIAGDFNGTADFNFSTVPTDTLYLKSSGTDNDPDIFFAKYDANDGLIWARKVGNADAQYLTGMAVRSNDLRIYGRFTGDVVFNPMPPVDPTSRLIGGGTYLAAYRTNLPSSANQLLTYSFATPAATGTITASDSVLVTVPAGTNTNGLVANFTVSPLAIATVGATAQVSGTTANNFSNIVTYTIMAEDSSTRDYYVKVTVEVPIGIDEISQDNASFKVWPNPASNQLNFEHPADVKLFDINGKLVLSATKVRALPVGRLAAGVYILENEQRQKRKIIKH